MTPDDEGLFASVASAPGGAGGGGGPGGAGGGGGGGDQSGPPLPPVQTIQGGDSCANQFPIALGYGPGKNLFRGTGDTTGDASADAGDTGCLGPTDGPDRVHAITVNAPEGGYLTARLVRGEGKTAFDSVLYVRQDDCSFGRVVCEDAFALDGNKQRLPANGGELVSIAVPPSPTPTTLYLYVSGVAANAGGRYELEVTLAKGDCLDPVPIFVEPGSPVRAIVSSEVSKNVMRHQCGIQGSFDVVLKVTRATPGAMLTRIDSADGDLALGLLKGACDNGRTEPEQGDCAASAGGEAAALDTDEWPGAQQSIYLVIQTGDAKAPRDIPIIFDPSGGADVSR